jgi:four helix bundle protein
LAQSRPAFVAKISIVLEEVDESAFWIEFIRDENLVEVAKIKELLDEAFELTSIFASARITSTARNKRR